MEAVLPRKQQQFCLRILLCKQMQMTHLSFRQWKRRFLNYGQESKMVHSFCWFLCWLLALWIFSCNLYNFTNNFKFRGFFSNMLACVTNTGFCWNGHKYNMHFPFQFCSYLRLKDSLATKSPLQSFVFNFFSGGVSLFNSGLIPVGNSSHAKENSINLQLFPTNQNAPDNFGPVASRPEKLGECIG